MGLGIPLLLVCTDRSWSVASYSTEPNIDLNGVASTPEIAKWVTEQSALDVQIKHLVSVFGKKRVESALAEVKP